MATVLEQAMKLSTEEKLDLLSSLWDNLAQQPENIPVSGWQREELAKRIESQQSNPQAGQTWEEVKREILNGSK
jgi:putative addiction module component (TIGR02574 family)